MNRPWQPSATIDALRRRAGIINRIREFFAERGVLEVDTPSLSHAAVSDPFLHPLPPSMSRRAAARRRCCICIPHRNIR